MPYHNFPLWVGAAYYFTIMHRLLIWSIALCKFVIIKNCLTDVIIFGYQVPKPMPWEFLWAGNTLVWHFVGAFAMGSCVRNMLKVYVYTNPFVTMFPLLIFGLKHYRQIEVPLIFLLENEIQDIPLLIFWSMVITALVITQAQFLYYGYRFLEITAQRAHYNDD